MTLRSTFLSGAAVAALASPSLALTADEVWQNQTGYLAALGIVAEATPARDGTTLVMSDIRYVWTVPMGLGEVSVTSPDVTFVEMADGTVSVSYPPKFRVTLRADLTAEGETASATAEFGIRLEGRSQTASGTPAAVSYATRTALMDVVLDRISVEGVGIEPGDIPEIDVVITVTDVSTDTTISDEGETHALSALSTTGTSVYEISMQEGNGSTSTNVGTSDTSSSTTTLTVPRKTVDWLNLSTALRDGLAVEFTAESAGSRQQSVARTDGAILSDLSQTVDRITNSFALSSAGLSAGGEVQTMTYTVGQFEAMPLPLPLPVTLTVEKASSAFAIPLLADPAPQAASFEMALRGITMPDDLWSLFDPGAVLPRDPATLAFGIDAEVVSRADLPDVMAWETLADRIEAGESPVDLVSLNVTGLEAAAIGAMLTGEAAFTFDNADRTTFPGFPRPEGEASAQITGLYAALGRLSQIGLLPTEAGLGARAAIGMFAKATGDDQLASTLAIGPDGTITVNGLPFPLP
jgi:hypothetical protein